MLLNYLEPSYQIGPLTIHLYGTFLAIGMIAGLFTALKLASERNIKSDYLYEAIVIRAFIWIFEPGARMKSSYRFAGVAFFNNEPQEAWVEQKFWNWLT